MGVHQLSTLLLIAILALTAVLAFPEDPGDMENGLPAAGCAIPVEDGFLPDRDCDGLDDHVDNCKYATNSDQLDADRNGIGDACDLLLTSITLEPGTRVEQGSFFTVRIEIINKKPYEIMDVQVRARQPELDLDVSTLVESLTPEERAVVELVLKAPGCVAPGTYELVFTTDHQEGQVSYTQARYQRIEVTSAPERCLGADGAIDNTILETILHQEAEAGDRVIYPVRVTNLNAEAKTYRLSLQDINHIGSYRIDPNPVFTVPAGRSETLFLSIDSAHFAPVGRNEFALYLETEGRIEETRLSLRFIKAVGADLTQALTGALQLALIIIVLALIIGAGIVAYRKLHEDEPPKGRPRDEQGGEFTYY